jgi:hypothetical protein
MKFSSLMKVSKSKRVWFYSIDLNAESVIMGCASAVPSFISEYIIRKLVVNLNK